MPKLLLFATCQKAIMDKRDNSVSIISLLNAVMVGILANEPVPPDAMLPIECSLIASWFQQKEDEGKTFQQKVQIFYPDESVFPSETISQPFTMDGPVSSTIHVLQAFPIGQEGTYQIVLSLREMQSDNWQEVSRIPFEIKYDRLNAGQDEQQP